MSIAANSPAVDTRERRLAAGLTQIELAMRAGISLTSLRCFEAGYRPSRGTAFQRMLVALEQAEVQKTPRRLIPYCEVMGHLELGVLATDGPVGVIG